MKLSEYLTTKKIKAAQFASLIGKHRSSVLRFCDGTRRPDLETLERIHEHTGGEVTAQDFFAKPPKAPTRKRKRITQ